MSKTDLTSYICLLNQPCTVERENLVERMFDEFTLFKHLAEKVWRMNRSAKGLLIISSNLDDFSLANRRRFIKFSKLYTHQNFPLSVLTYAWYLHYTCTVSKDYFVCDVCIAIDIRGDWRYALHNLWHSYVYMCLLPRGQ